MNTSTAESTTPTKPKALPVDANAIPGDLKQLPQWVVWRYEWDHEDRKWDKPPRRPDGTKVSSAEPSTWSEFDVVILAYQSGAWDGIGFVVAEKDPFFIVDLDGVIEGDWEWIPWSPTLVKRFKSQGVSDPLVLVKQLSTYCERSPSGTGLRIIGRGKLPANRELHDTTKAHHGIEFFSCKHYYTITGRHVPGTPADIRDAQTAVSRLHEQIFGKQKERTAGGQSDGQTHGDEEIVAAFRRAKNAAKFDVLMRGDRDSYPTPSEADAALAALLAFYTRDPEQIERIMRTSALVRPKWDKQPRYVPGTIQRALELVTEEYDWQPNGKRARVRESAEPGQTDLGNARRLATQHAGLVRYCYPTKSWLVWDGKRYAPDVTGAIERVGKKTIAEIWKQARQEPDSRRRAALAGHAARSEGAARIHAMIGLAQSEPGVPILPDEMDKDPFLLNCPNGTLDLRTGELRPHNQADLITKLCPTPYDAQAACPLWEAAILRHMDGSKNLVQFLQRLYGYCLTGDVSEQIFVIFYGKGQNGKSLALNTIRAVMGPDYSLGLTTEFLMIKKQAEHPTERMDLKGRRLCVAIETEDGQRLSEAFVKYLTGSEPVKGRHMYSDFVEFIPTHKIILACNHRPRIKSQDYAIWRRIRLVPFTVTIPSKERDKQLPNKLLAEAPGILAWIVRGCLEWQRDGLGDPLDVQAATENYRADEDTLGLFLDECCTLHPRAQARASELLDAFQKYTGDKGMTSTRFGRLLTERGFDRAKIGGTMYRLGIGLTADAHDETYTPGGDANA